MSPLASLTGVSKSFAGVRVLKDVDFDVLPGEVHALLGENGAGKSTLIKIIAGVHAPDGGTIRIGEKELAAVTPRDAVEGGIATVYQELLLFPELTVAENVFLGHAPTKGAGRLDWTQMRRRSRRLLDSLDSHDLDVDAKVGTLSVANRQRVEIAKALSQNARVLIMDEPTAALADADVRRLMDVVRRLRERGVGIVYVSHKLPEIFALADRVTVLRDGALIGTRPIGEVTEQSLVAMMVGRAIDHLFPKTEPSIRETVLKVEGLSFGDRFRDVSFELRRGEILGMAGLVGSGRTEVALTIFGITPATAGTIQVEGSPVAITSPRQACDLGIAYVPEDRGLQGLVRPLTVAENISLASLGEGRLRHLHPLRRRGAARGRLDPAARHPRPRAGAGGGAALGRQPAEGRPRQVAGDEPEDPDHGRADPRHRRRRQVRDPRADEPARPGGDGHPDDLHRAAGGARHERPRAGHARRPPRRQHRPRARRTPRSVGAAMTGAAANEAA